MARAARSSAVLALLLLAAACGGSAATQRRAPDEPGRSERGLASFYSRRFDGRKTASGERFSSRDLTAAHRVLPFGTRVRVTNERNGRSVVVRVNDRGPFSRGRVIDLSWAAAEAIDMIAAGLVPVVVEVVR